MLWMVWGRGVDLVFVFGVTNFLQSRMAGRGRYPGKGVFLQLDLDQGFL